MLCGLFIVEVLLDHLLDSVMRWDSYMAHRSRMNCIMQNYIPFHYHVGMRFLHVKFDDMLFMNIYIKIILVKSGNFLKFQFWIFGFI